MESASTIVVRDGLGFGESPRWHDGRLWYSDFYRRGVFSMRPDGDDERLEHGVDAQPSGLGWLANGDLLCVSMIDHRVVRFADHGADTWADIGPYCGFWANDMAVAPSGHAYVGNFGFDLDTLLAEQGPEGLMATPPPTTNLVVLDPRGNVIQVVPDMAFPNGTVITPDRRTLIVGETMAFRLTAFSINADGTLADRRVWAQLDLVANDGMCLDAEGQIWVANALAHECLRVREGGEITARVTTSQNAYACMLGGQDRRRLFVMTAPTSDRFTIAEQTRGAIESVEVAVAGAGWP